MFSLAFPKKGETIYTMEGVGLKQMLPPNRLVNENEGSKRVFGKVLPMMRYLFTEVPARHTVYLLAWSSSKP
jgi:hypothetical protein